MKNSNSLYKMIYATLLAEIEEGVYSPGKQLPTEAELSARFYVSRITSGRALNMLAQDGIVVRIAGRGTFVRKDCGIPMLAGQRFPKSRAIALVMGGYGAAFGLDIINGAIYRAQELGFHLIVQDTGNNQKEETKILRALRSGGAEGIIFQPAHGEMYNEVILDAQLNRYPMVMIDRMMNGISIPYIGLDNVKAGYDAARRLIEAGHTHISLMALEGDTSSSLRERMEGCLQACEEHGISTSRELWLTRIKGQVAAHTDAKQSPAYPAMIADRIQAHLRRYPQITGVFATEYMVAQGVVEAAEKLGLLLGHDLSIISVDCPPQSNPPLSHLRQPQQLIGATAVDTLRHLILSGKVPATKTLLEGEWVPGCTLGAPSTRASAEHLGSVVSQCN